MRRKQGIDRVEIHAYDMRGKRIPGGLGTCGGNADLCNHCHTCEREELRAWAKEKPAPFSGEDYAAYWKRIGGAFLDAWYAVAAEQYRR